MGDTKGTEGNLSGKGNDGVNWLRKGTKVAIGGPTGKSVCGKEQAAQINSQGGSPI